MTLQTLRAYTALLVLAVATVHTIPPSSSRPTPAPPKILILGGGVAGVIAARTLHANGIDNFVIVEARDEVGGRLRSHIFGGKTVELGANWIQGTRTDDGPKNPILSLAEKHGVHTQFNDFGNITTFDSTGAVNFMETFNESVDAYTKLIVEAGQRISKGHADATARTGYSLTGTKPKTPREAASEYYQFDWKYAQTPEQTSWLASSLVNNYTLNPEQGGFSEENLLSLDQRGFKALIQEEAAEFLSADQLLLNSTVTDIAYSTEGVSVTLASGEVIVGEYALCTFSLGVLQHNDVSFTPPLPIEKQEAIQGMVMATYTKIFLQFPENFWFDTEMALYADAERGRYPVWQSLDHPAFLPGSGILFATVTGDHAARIESLPDAAVQSEVMAVLRAMYPRTALPDPTAFYFPRWGTDPLSRGSYANWPTGLSSTQHDRLRAAVGRLWFAGEATSRRYFGFLHGAYFEGLEVATALVGCIRDGGCIEPVHDDVDVRTFGAEK